MDNPTAGLKKIKPFVSLSDLLTPAMQSAGATLGEQHMLTSVLTVLSKATGVPSDQIGIITDKDGTPVLVTIDDQRRVSRFDDAYADALRTNPSSKPALGTLRETPRGGSTTSEEFPAEFSTRSASK